VPAGALAALVLVLLAACGGSSTTLSRRVAFIESDGSPRLSATAITVVRGDTLKLTVGNLTDAPQQFTVDGFGIERTIEPDGAVTVEIEAKDSGTYRMYSERNRDIDPLSIVVPG
jgi:hypothetical protein